MSCCGSWGVMIAVHSLFLRQVLCCSWCSSEALAGQELALLGDHSVIYLCPQMSPYWGSQRHSSLLVQGDTHRPWLTLTAAPQPLKGAWSKHCKYNTLQTVTKIPLPAPEWPFLTFPAQHLCSLLLLKAKFSPLRKKAHSHWCEMTTFHILVESIS